MQPRDFIDFISGKFVRRFIADRASLERAMQRLDDSADADGRYRVNYFSCGIDIWRAAFAELLSSSDVVLMDLRGFDSARTGALFELKQIAKLLPQRVVLVRTPEPTWVSCSRRFRLAHGREASRTSWSGLARAVTRRACWRC